MKIKTLDITKKNFNRDLLNHLALKLENSKVIESSVTKILDDIKKNKDKALIKLANKYDNTAYKKASESKVSESEIVDAYAHISKQALSNLKKAIINIKRFSKKQVLKSWSMKINGSILGEKVTAIEKVGIYVPGGKACYPVSYTHLTLPTKRIV